MKDKEKQIEEMAKDLEKVEKEVYSIIVKETRAYVKEHHKYNTKEDYSLAHIKTVHERTAEDMFNLGYRKLPEDSVVLSREEYKTLLDNNIRADLEYWEDMLAKERKETAEKIYYKAEKKAYFKDGGYYDKDRYYIDMEDLKEILKQFGVEIKE